MNALRVAFCALVAVSLAAGAHSRAADFDGDGVDDSIDCRPVDATNWSAPSEAQLLLLSGKASTAFQWSAPATPGSTALVYDVIRATSASNFDTGTCLVTNTSSLSPAFTDTDAVASAFYYLVRSKTACGSSLGTKSPATPRTGVDCSTGIGGTCTIDADCTSGYCCGGTCADASTDVNNCGGCGIQCVNPGGTTSCSGGVCQPVCAGSFQNCDGFPTNGCETDTNSSVTNCGGCGQVCGGFNGSTDDAFCVSALCGMSCRGENYDVDNNPANGCEAPDSPTGNHTQITATNQGSKTCNDSDTFSFIGRMVNDSRTHTNPAVTGFDVTTGSAPDWNRISATGGTFCTDDVSATLTVTGSTTPTCYKLYVVTDVGTYTCQTNGSGLCTITQGSGSYHDNTTIFLRIERTCTVPPPQSVNYTVGGHF